MKIHILTITIECVDRKTRLISAPIVIKAVIDRTTADYMKNHKILSCEITHTMVESAHFMSSEIKITGGKES